jgi:hypothetical protein
MLTMGLNSEGDLDFVGGKCTMLRDADAVRQKLKQRFQFFQGEWFLDLAIGMPYYQSILVKNPDVPLLRQIFSNAITKCRGVSRLDALDLTWDKNTREITIAFSAALESGEILIAAGTDAVSFILPGS